MIPRGSQRCVASKTTERTEEWSVVKLPLSVVAWKDAEARAADVTRVYNTLVDAGLPVPLDLTAALRQLRSRATKLMHRMLAEFKVRTSEAAGRPCSSP